MADRVPLIRHPVAIAGALVTTVAAVGFLAMALAMVFGLFTNPYAGLVVFVALPALFVFGLLLIPMGGWLERRALRRDPSARPDWPVVDLRKRHIRRTALGVVALTAVNVVIVLLAGYGGLHWMESPAFCGQTCHTPMHPQYTAWQVTPHARVACVGCHVGEGTHALIQSKLSGVRQLAHVITNTYPRPIPASAANLRPALEVCGNCHTATVDLGERTRIVREFGDDEANSEITTVLDMHVGGPGRPTRSGRAIHWHADPNVRIEYIATDADRQTIPWVRMTDGQGVSREFTVEGTTPEALQAGTRRVMDCVDCHNAAAHRIAPTAGQAVDRAIAAGDVSPSLPFVRREGVRLVTQEHPDQDTALRAIASELRAFYASVGADETTLARSIIGIQDVYRRNVFPAMKVTWGVYKDNRGHMTSDGCFRCHDDSHLTPDGSAISGDCSYCHDQR